MTAIRRRLLERLVSRHERTETPVGVSQLATPLGMDTDATRSHLDALQDCELVTSQDGGYVPTVTAHELLALDLNDDSLLVVDVPDE